MATITARKRKRGTQYTARIRIMRDGVCVIDESETFSTRQLAAQWAANREAALNRPGGIEAAMPGISIEQVLTWYKEDYDSEKWGDTKLNDINLLLKSDLAKLDASRYTSGQIVSHVRKRRAEGAGPSTVNNDLIWLRSALRGARIGRDAPIELQPLDDAAHLCRKEKLISKSNERTRRPTVAEIEALIEYLRGRDRRGDIPMVDLVLFAMTSSRRQNEICRIRWDDVDEARQRVLVRDMKHPRALIDTWCDLPSRAWQILQRQPKIDDRIFPFVGKSIGSAFSRSCNFLGIEDLRFHDLRHEATSCLFELDWDLPHVAKVTGHKAWTSLQRYTQIEERGDKWAHWDQLASL